MQKIIIVTSILVIVGAFGWYTLSPLFINEVVNEELAFDRTTRSIQNQDEQKSLATDTELAAESPASTKPLVLTAGVFQGSDALHKSSGEVFVVKTENGNVLRFENFTVTNGPDLRVLLSTNANPTSKDLGEYIEVEKLKGNIGNQNYELSNDLDISIYKSVIIYCEPFNVVFAIAPLN